MPDRSNASPLWQGNSMAAKYYIPLTHLIAAPLNAQGEATAPVMIKAQTQVRVVTSAALSSKTSAKGDPVALTVAEDVIVDGKTIIAKGTEVVGEIADVRQKAMFGQSGRLGIRPLYLRIGAQTVRLTGVIGLKAKTSGGAIVGLALASALFTGRSAVIPAGTEIPAAIERDVTVTLTPK